jgi:hypothetical protein
VTRLRAGRPRHHGSIPGTKYICPISDCLHRLWGPPACLPIWRVQEEMPMANQPKREAGLLPPSSAEIIEWVELNYPTHISLHGVHRHNFTFCYLGYIFARYLCQPRSTISHGLLISPLCINLFTCSPNQISHAVKYGAFHNVIRDYKHL